MGLHVIKHSVVICLLTFFPDSLSETAHEGMSGPITIPALWFQVETYRDVGIVSHCLIEKKTIQVLTEKSSEQF